MICVVSLGADNIQYVDDWSWTVGSSGNTNTFSSGATLFHDMEKAGCEAGPFFYYTPAFA